jgi:formamidopyrimidine-DNA glycosylase
VPELPEVEAVVHALRDDGLVGARLKGLTVLRSGVLSPQSAEEVADRTVNQSVVAVRRRAKSILVDLSSGETIHVHLRMTGDLRIEADPRLYVGGEATTVRLEWRLVRKRRLLFVDPRALGRVRVLTAAESQALDASLGIEPLGRGFTNARFISLARRSNLPAKLFLLDQTKVAGLGNIYAAEALFRAGISPLKPLKSLSDARLSNLRQVIRETLRGAVHSVYLAYRSPAGYRNHQDDFHRLVYGRSGEVCSTCDTTIQRISQGGRSTYFCPLCQA